jgi:hypothetical protein
MVISPPPWPEIPNFSNRRFKLKIHRLTYQPPLGNERVEEWLLAPPLGLKFQILAIEDLN